MKDHDFESLWETAGEPGPPFEASQVAELPEAARRYFTHAIAPGTPMATAVKLTMHGEMRLKDDWEPFEAEQVLRAHRGMVWRASVRMKGLPMKGSDRYVDGEGAMKWKLFGLIPVVREAGPAVTRSAAGRAQIESIWLPPALLAESVAWEGQDDEHVRTTVKLGDEVSTLALDVAEDGRLERVSMLRWGTPDGPGTESRQETFGCQVVAEKTFEGFTVPSEVRVGWYFGSDRFESEGEFFRGTIDAATFR